LKEETELVSGGNIKRNDIKDGVMAMAANGGQNDNKGTRSLRRHRLTASKRCSRNDTSRHGQETPTRTRRRKMECEYNGYGPVVEKHNKRVDRIVGGTSLNDLFTDLEHYTGNPDGVRGYDLKLLVEDLRDRINAELDRLEIEGDPRNEVLELFENWARTYNIHMAETMHDRAIETLLKQTIELRRLGFGGGNIPILGNDILEMSGGTGTVIKLLCQNLPPEEVAKLNITLNDISPAMQAIAREVLEGSCNVAYTRNDLRYTEFHPEMYDSAFLFQTLHLITDPELIRKARSPDAVVGDPEHREMKVKVIKNGFSAVRDWGWFGLGDEWPAELSGDPETPMEIIRHRLFKRTFKPIATRWEFMNQIMTRMPGARFVAELKARIDSKHPMYMLLYQKDPEIDEVREKLLPTTGWEAELENKDIGMINRAREAAAIKVMQAFKAIDRHFRETYTPVNGERENWTDFTPIGDEITVNPTSDVLKSGKRSNAMVLSRQLHTMNDDERNERIEMSIDAVDPGGILGVIGEFNAPPKSPHVISMEDFRNKVMKQHSGRVVFEGSLAQPIMRGYGSTMHGHFYRKTA